MGGISSADQSPGGTSTGTVEQSATATQSYSPYTDAPPEVAYMQKLESRPQTSYRSAIDCPGAFSLIQAGRGTLFPPSDQHHEGTDNRSTAAVYHPMLAGTGSTNTYDVTQMSVEERCRIPTGTVGAYIFS